MTAPGSGRVAAGSLASAAGLIAAVTLVSRVVGFGRWVVFSGSVGGTQTGTAYSTANLLPNVLYEVAAGGALAAVAVPLVAAQLRHGTERDADRIASALLTWAATVLVPLAVVLALLAHPVAELMMSARSSTAQIALTARLVVIFAVQIPLYGLGIVLSGVLQAHRRFLAASLAPLLSSLVVIASYLLFAGLADGRADDAARLPAPAGWVLGLGTTLGVVALSVPLLVPVRRCGVRLHPTYAFPPGAARRASSLAGAGIVALLAQQVAVAGTAWVANHRGGTGVINLYQYLQAVYLLPYAVLAVPIAMSAFPALAAGERGTVGVSGAPGAPGADPDAVATLARSSRLLVLAMGAGVAALVAVAGPVGGFFGALDRGPAGRIVDALPVGLASFAPGLLGYGLAALLTRALYARGRPGEAAGWVAAGWALAILGPLLLTRSSSGAGTTLTVLGVFSSLGMTLSAVGLALAVRGAWGHDAVRGLGRSASAAIGGALLVSVVAVLLVGRSTSHGMAGSVALGLVVAVLAVAAYLGLAALLDPRTTRLVVAQATTRLRISRPAGRR